MRGFVSIDNYEGSEISLAARLAPPAVLIVSTNLHESTRIFVHRFVGKPLNEQELLNANYSGPFVTAAKAVFSNSSNSKMQMWKNYVDGDEKRQQVLAEALRWVSKGDVDGYMSKHRQDSDIGELKMYFDSAIDWIDGVFKGVKDEMCGLEWGRLYEA